MAPLILFLIGCAVVYVASIESAFGAMVRLPARLTVERDIRHESLTTYLEDPQRLFVVTRLLRGLLFATAAVVLARMIGVATPQAVGLLLLAIMLFVVVCEQLVPSVLVRRDAGRTLELLLPSFDLVLRVVGPVTGGLLRLARPPRARSEARSNGAGSADPTEPGGETVDAAAVADETEERRLLRSVVDFGGTLVREVMTPRPDIVAIAHDATVAEFRALFAEEEYSRIPVYEDNLDNILGFVFAKDLVTLDGVQGTSRIVPQLLRPAHVVPEGKRVAELLRELQVKHVQSAVVVDEYGGTAGLVTIEDLLEEIVGEIRDEYDDESDPIVDEGDGTFVFLASVSVGDMVEHLGVTIERDGFETVGGYLLTRLGRVPTVGETVEIDALVVEVLEAERRRVRKVRVHRRDAVGSAAG
ncbi:MAG: HlyC/CorC family transporter [Acidobacteria bacterium]|nr:HlyC/CorC family transporter [Acidobacteriota bacterium]